MWDRLERHGPRTPAARLGLAFVALALSVPALVGAAAALVNPGAQIRYLFLLGIPGLFLATVGYHYAASVVRRANETPEPDWWGGPESRADSGQAVDPVERLQKRYAEGELSTEEFEHRMDRLVESDAAEADRSVGSGTADQERFGEREDERA